MKLFALICTLLVASQVQASPRVGNVLDDLVKQALEVVRKHMVAQDPLPVPDPPKRVINDDDAKIYLTLQMSKATVSKSSNFVVNKINNNLATLHSEFGLTFPSIHLEGDFDISGSALGKKVSGQGKLKIEITGLVVNGAFQMETVSGGTLQVKSNSFSYSYQNYQISETGLKVEGMTDEQSQDWFSNTMLRYIETHQGEMTQKVAEQAREDANQLVKGKTLNDLIAALRKFIQSGSH